MWLSFSKYDTYLKCPRKYKYQIDKVQPPQKESKYFAVYGILIQKFFEDYTNLYLPRGVEMVDSKIRAAVESSWEKVLEKEYVNWNDPWVKQTPNELLEECIGDVIDNVRAFDFWPSVISEVTYKVELRKSRDVLNGRVDFIRKLSDGNVEILDGKSTKHMDRVDPEQLLFYALMYFLRHKKLPVRLGFLYYRYQVIKYIDFNRDILIQFKNKLALAKKAIKIDHEFEARVKLSKVCQWCPYKLLCKPYMEKKEANAKKRDKIKIEPEGDIITFGLDSI